MSRGLTPPQLADCTMDQLMIMVLAEADLGSAVVKTDATLAWPADVPRSKEPRDTSGGASVVQRIRNKNKANQVDERAARRARKAALRAAKRR